jgi:heat shock protein HslJ
VPAFDRFRFQHEAETTMVCLRCGFACLLGGLLVSFLAASLTLARADDSTFPFDQELMLDTTPKPGTKRIPIIEIAENGATTISLWCVNARAQATVGDGTITFNPEPAQQTQCMPALLSADEELLAAFAAVTTWKRTGDAVDFVGTTTLRFHLMTN